MCAAMASSGSCGSMPACHLDLLILKPSRRFKKLTSTVFIAQAAQVWRPKSLTAMSGRTLEVRRHKPTCVRRFTSPRRSPLSQNSMTSVTQIPSHPCRARMLRSGSVQAEQWKRALGRRILIPCCPSSGSIIFNITSPSPNSKVREFGWVRPNLNRTPEGTLSRQEVDQRSKHGNKTLSDKNERATEHPVRTSPTTRPR